MWDSESRGGEPGSLPAIRRVKGLAAAQLEADAALIAAMREALRDGHSPREIAEQAGVAHTTVLRWLRNGRRKRRRWSASR